MFGIPRLFLSRKLPENLYCCCKMLKKTLETADSLEKYKAILVAIAFSLRSESENFHIPPLPSQSSPAFEKTKEFSDRMCWAGVKLFAIGFQWWEILSDNTIEDICISTLLNTKILVYLNSLLKFQNAEFNLEVALALLKITESLSKNYPTSSLKLAILDNLVTNLASIVEKGGLDQRVVRTRLILEQLEKQLKKKFAK